ncbi:hypothetical protein KAJ26_06215, partial [bacterium]|nr:hypothetical protein [bacterium]
MKIVKVKLIISILIVLCLSQAAYSGFSISINPGMNFSDFGFWFDDEEIEEMFRNIFEPKFNGNAGLTLKFDLSRRSALRVGYFYYCKGTMSDDESISSYLNLHYLSFPLTVQYSVLSGKTDLYLIA